MLDWVEKGLRKGYLLGPFSDKDLPDGTVHSPFAAVTQKNKIRPIINMSSPKFGKKLSVNDTIPDKHKTVSYIKFKEIVNKFHACGSSAHGWVADGEDAYLIVPVHENDIPFLAFRLGSFTFICTTLMFGLSSACNIYSRLGDSFKYICINQNKKLFTTIDVFKKLIELLDHYLDDYFGVHKNKEKAKLQFKLFKKIAKLLNIPLKSSKFQFGQKIKLLGWSHNLKMQKFFIPNDKAREIILTINTYINAYYKKHSRKFEDWQSLEGQLRWALTAVHSGSSILLDIHMQIYKKHRKKGDLIPVTLNIVKSLELIKQVLTVLNNGVSYDWILNKDPPDIKIYVDACQSGVGGWSDQGHWYHYKFNKKVIKQIKLFNKPDMQFLELMAIIIAMILWSNDISFKCVYMYTDNEPVQYNLQRWHIPPHRTDKLFLLKILSSLLLTQQIRFKINRIDTNANYGADILSRDKSDLQHNNNINIFKNWFPTQSKNTLKPVSQSKKLTKKYLKMYNNNLKNTKLIKFLVKNCNEFNLFDKTIE